MIQVLTGEPVNRSTPHISLHHVTRFEPITAAHFDQMYINTIFSLDVADIPSIPDIPDIPDIRGNLPLDLCYAWNVGVSG